MITYKTEIKPYFGNCYVLIIRWFAVMCPFDHSNLKDSSSHSHSNLPTSPFCAHGELCE